jgi:membrane protein required for colicin V production
MNWLDIVILILVLGLGFMGYRQGVIRLLFTLAGGIVGLVLAGRLWGEVAPVIPIDNEGVQKLAAFAVIVIVVLIIASIVAKIVKGVLKILLLGWVDGLAGAVIGITLGAFAATAFVAAAGIVPSEKVQTAVEESTMAEPLIDNLDFVLALLPGEFGDVKDLLEKGKSLTSLLSKGAELLEQGEQLQKLIEQGQALAGTGDGLLIAWEGLDDYEGSTIRAMFEPEDGGDAIGPFNANVQDDGTAALRAGSGYDATVSYDVYYYIDGNDNGECDESSSDVRRVESAGAGDEVMGVAFSEGESAVEDICSHF